MDVNEEHVQTLLAMGFPNESEVRRALKLGKNDLNEAVAVLTNEHPSSGFDTLEDVEMKDVTNKASQGPVYGPLPPPSYDEVVESEKEISDQQTSVVTEETTQQQDDSGVFEFPTCNLYELEGRVFTESWSIPYKKEESLGKCLIAATKLAADGLCDADEHCKRFMDRCMPECFQKLCNSGAVHRWGTEIQEGIYLMCQLLIELVVARLQHEPVPCDLLHVLSLVFNPDVEFHYKNRGRKPDRLYWEDKFAEGDVFAISPSSTSSKEPYGWLTNLINTFAIKGGFMSVKKLLAKETTDAPAMAALLHPIGLCAEFLNPEAVKPVLAPGLEKIVTYIQELSENDLKDKKVGSVCYLLASVKLLCLEMWKKDVQAVDELRLEVVLRMLKSPNFNAKMNALKEVTRLIEDSQNTKNPKTAIHRDKVRDWLEEKNVLSIALEGNIDQAQYCDKIKGIVDFLGSSLSLEELTQIWKMQHGQTNHVIENIHSIMAVAAVQFNQEQLEHFFLLVQKSWQVDPDRIREKLLGLIGKIGRDSRVPKTTTRVLELLWDLAHLPALATHLIEQALGEHLAILCDSYVKEQVKRSYVAKCVDDIKKGVWVLPALKQLLHISKNIAKSAFHKADKGIINDLNKNFDMIKLVTNSLVKCHKMAVQAAGEKPLQGDELVDGRYTHKDYVNIHLEFLQFLLQEGVLYLAWHRARDIWDTLVASSECCEWDRETCFEWFTNGLTDLEAETQEHLFQKELLKMDPSKLTEKGFKCWRYFFESVNMYENKLKKQTANLVVEKLDLIGMEYLWGACLNAIDENIAMEAIRVLLNMSYNFLAPRLKKDPVAIHKKFIDECYSRLEAANITLTRSSAINQAISNATRTVTAAIIPEIATVPSPSRSAKLLNIERLLLVAEKYVLAVEEAHTVPRIILPHGASFQGHPVNLYINCDSPKQEFLVMGHSNERLFSVRQKIARHVSVGPDQVQIVANDKMLTQLKDQKLLHQLGFEDEQQLNVRILTGLTPSTKEPVSTSTAAVNPIRSTLDLEQEKMLPGVVMASGGQVFEMLYQLADLEEPRITNRLRNLLKLIPTDPTVQDTLDGISQSQRTLRQSSPEEASPAVSPKSSPRKGSFTPAPAPSPRLAPKEMLKNLFDANAPDMCSFRVLYNLEVLSSKLMPTLEDAGTLDSAKHFCDDFLNSNGLQLVVGVLQKDVLATDIDYETRQGCYAISLQLLRFLLCGETVTGDKTLSLRRRRPSSASSTGGVGASRDSGVGTYSSRNSCSMSSAASAVQTMDHNDFTETVACFMRVTWAAAAGKLHLASASQPIREVTAYGTGRRSRQSSTGSTTSTSSDGDNQSLHAGVCVHQGMISNKDTTISKEALELLVTCLQLRSQLIASFYNLPCVSDFIIDVLVGCTSTEIRKVSRDQFYALSQTVPQGNSQVQTPHQFLLQVLLKARLPFWVSSSSTRGSSQRLLTQCTQYFELRCSLLENLSLENQQKLAINVTQMIEDELAWLGNFNPSEHKELHDTDNVLLEGHLNLLRTLMTCEGVNKRELGKQLLDDLLHDFLFPASKLISESITGNAIASGSGSFDPKCSKPEARNAAYQLLVELADGCSANLKQICENLIFMHHQANPDSAQEWEYLPPVDSRAECGFVGLKNAGATCYMNSVIQQLFMAPGVPEYILATGDDEEPVEDSVFYQIQQVFGNLLDSKLQYYVPEKFWKVFKLWGQTVNVREQQDAFDFFTALIDQLDEHLKKIGKEQVFKRNFQGIFSDQKICKDCPHRYEREEPFYALNLTVKNATLQDSLDQFVKGELLEGDNAYFCEKCGEKRNTIKRMCIKTLPPLLCIQLKRFDYDWEANRALKFDDHFPFPWILDMEPYTAGGMARRETQPDNGVISDEQGDGDTKEFQIVTTGARGIKPINYELVGVIVHSGQANAGHYYSFIKDRRGNILSNQNRGKWFKFNDTIVEEFELTDTTIEAECFGGTYKAKVYDQASSYPEERIRFWNGYLLFYEKVEDLSRTPSAKKSRVSRLARASANKSSGERDSLSELTELVHKGDRQGIFTDKMPARIQQLVQDENLRFMKNRDVYNADYLRFVLDLVSKNAHSTSNEKYSEMCLEALQLSINFLTNTYLRTKKKLRSDMRDWVDTINNLISGCKEACFWLVDFLATDHGVHFIKQFLLICPQRDTRQTVGDILEITISNFFKHGGGNVHKSFDEVIENLLQMLNKDAPDNCKTCYQYFRVLCHYVEMGTKSCAHMFGHNAFQRLITFLLGPQVVTSDQESTPRRWSSLQARDFGPLHTTLATLVLNCDVTEHRTEGPENYTIRRPETVKPQVFLKMSSEMVNSVFGNDSHRYIREIIMAVREVGGYLLTTLGDMLVYCSFCNATFSMNVLTQIMTQYTSAPSSELKALFNILQQLLLVEDPLQLQRLKCVIDGFQDDHENSYDGMLAVIKINHSGDSRRSYQCIKFLVSLANKSSLAKDYLIQTPTKWQWAVNWLKRKMSDYTYWGNSSTITTSNEDSNSKSFQRTISAQDTLAEATALLTELEAQEGALSDMDTNNGSNDETQENSQGISQDLDEVDN